MLPVLSTAEAAAVASTASQNDTQAVPQPHPSLSRTRSTSPSFAHTSNSSQFAILSRGEHTEEILSELGLSAEERVRLKQEGAIGQSTRAKL